MHVPDGEIMWVHPNLIEDESQWTIVSRNKSKGKAKASVCNIMCASSKEADFDVPPLTDSEEETMILATQTEASLVAET